MTDWTFEQNHAICDGKCPNQNKTKDIIITENTLNKIRTLTKQVSTLEWMAMLQGKETKTQIIVTDLIIPEQQAEKTHIELTKNGDIEAQKTPNIGWIHSHNNMQAFFSANDKRTASQNRLSIVVNNKLETEAAVLDKLPCGHKALIKANVLIETKEDKTFLKTIKDKIKEVITVVTETVTNKELTQTQLLSAKNRPKGMSKNEWKRLKKSEENKRMEERIIEEIEAEGTGWKGICQHCTMEIKEYEEAIFRNGVLYHRECVEHKEGEHYGNAVWQYCNR